MAAFFDDSGVFNPEDTGKFACLGMIVVPNMDIRKCGDAWWEMLEQHFRCPSPLQTVGIKVDGLIEAILNFLSKPPVAVRYMAAVTNKQEVWRQFHSDYFSRWQMLTQLHSRDSKKEITKLCKQLSSSLVKSTYEFLLQRLDYLSRDGDFDFSDAFVISDESSDIKVMLKTQAEIQAGLGKSFSLLATIVNRPWFGSSLHDPCLQMADWIAFVVRVWAEDSVAYVAYSYRIKQLLPNFRGYPDSIVGRGIVLCPNKECFPSLPSKDDGF